MSVPTKTGYTFAGFYDATSGGNMYYTAALASNKSWDKDTTSGTALYARWAAKQSALTFDLQGGSWKSGETLQTGLKATYGSAMPGVYKSNTTTLMTAPTKTGYTFAGFYDATSGGNMYYTAALASNKSWDKDTTSGTTLYARWAAKTSVLTFDLQGGSWKSGETLQTGLRAIYGSAMPGVYKSNTTTLMTAPTKTGYTFAGFYDATSGGNMYYTSTLGGTVWDKDTTSGTTLYAQWTAKTSTLTFDLQGGSWKSGETLQTGIKATFGSAMPGIYRLNTTTKMTAPTKTGYTLAGFYDATSGGNRYYSASLDSVKTWDKDTTGGTTLYAQWTAKTSALTFDLQGGSWKSGETLQTGIKATYGSAMPGVYRLNTTTKMTAPTKTGYTLAGFYDATSGGNRYYSASLDSVKTWDKDTTSGTELHAQWTAKQSALTFDLDGGSGGGTLTGKTATYGSAMPTPGMTVPTKNGYDFNGYYTEKNGKGTKYYDKSGNSVTSAANWAEDTTSGTTLYAYWTNATFSISWDMKGHGEDQKPTKTSYTFGDTYSLPSISNVTGWDFKGWCADSACSISASDIAATTSGNMSFYAKWERAQYKITYVMNGHGAAPTSPTGWTYGTPPTLKNPNEVEGWTFADWYTDKDCTDGKQANITATSSSDVTLYAKWTVNTHTVFWKYGGADGKTDYDVKNVAYASDVYMIDPGRKAGWKFVGWQASGANTSSYGYGNNEKMTMPDGNVTLTAQWTKLDRIAVNLADKHLGEATGKIWYWPEQGYAMEENPSSPEAVGSAIATPPSVTGYQFLGWYATEDQNDNDNPMIDGEGKLRTTSSISSVTTWYAHWKWVSCPVNLLAEYDDIPYVTSAGDPTSIPFARFGVALNECLEGGKLKSLPERTGYTFMGYYTKANPEVSTNDAEDPANFEGNQWIDRNGNLSTNKWNEYPTDKRGSITLYAAWRLDDCEVSFDVLSNVNPTVSEPVTVANAPNKTTWHYGKPKGEMTVPSEQTFYRHGYEFAGWYYTKDGTVSGEKVFVSDSKGNPTPANWEVVKKSVTLYPAWAAKTYKIKLLYNYPTVAGAPAEEVTSREIGPITYDATFDLSQYDPEYLFYTFENWYAKATDQLFDGAHMTANPDGTKRFTPRGIVAQTSPIEVYARWMDPGTSSYTLYVGTPGGTELVSETQHEYKWTETIVFNGTEAPALVENWRFVGWVPVESDKAARGMVASGGPVENDDTWSGFGPLLTRNLYFVAKWAPVKLSLTLQRTQPEDDGAWLVATDVLEDYEGNVDYVGETKPSSWSAVCESLNEERPDLARVLHYDTTQDPFVLPEVVRKGQVFEGWKLKGSNDEPAHGIVVYPSKQDNGDMRDLVYVPVFKDAIYKIILDGQGIGEDQTFENIAYSDEFTFPYPATLNTGSVFACWSSKPDTNSDAAEVFFPLEDPTPLAPVYDEAGQIEKFGLSQIAEVDEDGNNVIRVYAVWNSNYHVDVPLFANLAIDTERGDVIAGTNAISPDDRNEDKDATYRIESIRYEPLKNDDGVYAFEGTEDKVYLSVYAGLNTGDATDVEHLLYADNIGDDGEVTYTDAAGETATAKPLLIELGGTTPVVYGRTAPEGQPSLAAVTDKTGFVTFSQSNPLTIRYGLFFENKQTRKDFVFGSSKYSWLLPENDSLNRSESSDPTEEDYGRRSYWSGNTVDIAKLHYTVTLVNKTR